MEGRNIERKTKADRRAELDARLKVLFILTAPADQAGHTFSVSAGAGQRVLGRILGSADTPREAITVGSRGEG